MAKRRDHYAFHDQRPVQLDRIDQSRFWRRLDELSGAELDAQRRPE